MRNMKLLSVATMGIALILGIAACSGDMSGTGVEPPRGPEATTQPGIAPENPTAVPGQPGPEQPAQGGDPQNLAAALALHAATERIAADRLASDCGRSATCAAELEALKVYIARNCTGASANADCPPTILKFNDALNAMQVRGQQPIPVTFPQAKDVAFVITMMERGEGAGEPEGAVVPAVIVVAVAGDVGSMVDDVDWTTIEAKIFEAAPAEGASIAKRVEEALSALQSRNDTAASLLAGEPVAPAEAMAVLTAIAEQLR